jgi:hypothetical protein
MDKLDVDCSAEETKAVEGMPNDKTITPKKMVRNKPMMVCGRNFSDSAMMRSQLRKNTVCQLTFPMLYVRDMGENKISIFGQ